MVPWFILLHQLIYTYFVLIAVVDPTGTPQHSSTSCNTTITDVLFTSVMCYTREGSPHNVCTLSLVHRYFDSRVAFPEHASVFSAGNTECCVAASTAFNICCLAEPALYMYITGNTPLKGQLTSR